MSELPELPLGMHGFRRNLDGLCALRDCPNALDEDCYLEIELAGHKLQAGLCLQHLQEIQGQSRTKGLSIALLNDPEDRPPWERDQP